MSYLQSLIHAHHAGHAAGITSVCCTNAHVLQAAMAVALQYGSPLLVEATSNQVDQFGGYTGMRPADFVAYVHQLADNAGFPAGRLILGGDHLGPNTWQHLPPNEAMAHARGLIAAYVAAGFGKIHLDCSMACAGDPFPLPDAVVAARSADLAAVAEQAAGQAGLPCPVYVIGTEVPVPGGEASLAGGIQVTRPDAAAATLAAHRAAFAERGLDAAWERVIALVVQPGVDFDHSTVRHYAPHEAAALSAFVLEHRGLVYEAHSTDYQTEEALHALVRGHFAILKVGPAATHALREAWFALAAIEDELVPVEQRSHLKAVLERTMLEQPRHWHKHYAGKPEEQAVLRRYALSDRSRYYWGEAPVQQALARLQGNLDELTLPLPLLSQYLPEQAERVNAGRLAPRAADLARHKVELVLARYARACHANSLPC
ncbi:D-tagatose-bisphosphate aldolase, class II, non-catalytic subunit [Duganella sp. FT92W]|uniref:D-tagatose-bisphosphate aldolase, class II, non-catalytic subunit n=1 Tax=Pseudoduganella rivuli TaxID=2666085 RepID=A0A7X2IHS2_9BURK|nr:D-tagatose-bisphosphate aldolase, class II, non-catalytic subunit [Pseudoduganella rivuli]MRV70264.1 D-tagatose-bisphosphate aldolase, class II, non-catalytic subunit [Pseudoduganella rivuli]